MFAENEYLCDDLFKINIMTILSNNNNNKKKKKKIAYFSYLLESYNVLDNKLGHVNYNINIKINKL
jgi:hypothetical protein